MHCNLTSLRMQKGVKRKLTDGAVALACVVHTSGPRSPVALGCSLIPSICRKSLGVTLAISR